MCTHSLIHTPTQYPEPLRKHAHLLQTHLVEGGLGGAVHVLQGGLEAVHPRTTLQSWELDLYFRPLLEEKADDQAGPYFSFFFSSVLNLPQKQPLLCLPQGLFLENKQRAEKGRDFPEGAQQVSGGPGAGPGSPPNFPPQYRREAESWLSEEVGDTCQWLH